ncbi:MAG TPA: M28 family peptidase [Terriglobales bacterium]|nr:M28 family peptidase [Terriglobales bacterium]
MSRFSPGLPLAVILLFSSAAPQAAPAPDTPPPEVCAACIREHLDYLASDQLRGRGSATPDELTAAKYIAAELHKYGVPPAGDRGGYIQHVTLIKRTVIAPPRLVWRRGYAPPGSKETHSSESQASANAPIPKPVVWTHGKEMLVLRLARARITGPLQKIDLAGEPKPVNRGAMVFLDAHGGNPRAAAVKVMEQGAAAVLVPEYPQVREHWQQSAGRLPKLATEVVGVSPGSEGMEMNLVALSKEAASTLEDVPEGTEIRLRAPTSLPVISHTRNVVGEIRGSDPALAQAAILLSAHMDHLGVGAPVNGDSIYNGADDDASGTTAVLELARVLAAGPRPRRTVIFALFGSEELGGLGSTYFREHPPLPLRDLAANLEFEMIGRGDPAVPENTLWLTGWERSNLGPVLAEHGARLVGDPHPAEDFFARSDNYVLAQKGVVAQTVSSYGLHGDYHQPSDDVAHIDFKHMDEAIGSLLGPVEWLVNSDFRPEWKAGGRP